jgi:hypothetical protein
LEILGFIRKNNEYATPRMPKAIRNIHSFSVIILDEYDKYPIEYMIKDTQNIVYGVVLILSSIYCFFIIEKFSIPILSYQKIIYSIN